MRNVLVPVIVGLMIVGGFIGYGVFKAPPEASGPLAVQNVEQAADTRVFSIVPGESRAHFVIDEVLQGSPKTVVGSTDQVSGQIAVDATDLDPAQVGTIMVNARTFATDSSQRDRAIQNFILQTADHEYITFTPSGPITMPAGGSSADGVTLKLSGDLTIRGQTRPAIFETTVVQDSVERLRGSATTTIRYADWGIAIPQVPQVAGVADTVQLGLDFVATAA